MSKVLVVYWTGTGNTEMMANAIADGAKNAGAEVDVVQVADSSAGDIANYDAVFMGCPAMGDEVLEECEFEPFFAEAESSLSGKKLALFGSYGWGDGQWMRDWDERAKNAGATLLTESLIINSAPDNEGIAECENFGKKAVEAI